MKTGWLMEWEFEMRYAAPIRAHVNTMMTNMKPFNDAMRRLGISFHEAAKRMTEVTKAFEHYKIDRG